MSDNDRAIELGLIDVHGNILVDDEPDDLYDSPTDTEENSETIIVTLTPTKFLNSEALYLRSKLTNNQLSDSEINLEVMHDRYNENDPLALQVFCNHTFIGYIQKYNSKIDIDIDEWCFINNEKIMNLTLEWKENRLLLSRKLSFSEEEYLEKIIDEKLLKLDEFLDDPPPVDNRRTEVENDRTVLENSRIAVGSRRRRTDVETK